MSTHPGSYWTMVTSRPAVICSAWCCVGAAVSVTATRRSTVMQRSPPEHACDS